VAAEKRRRHERRRRAFVSAAWIVHHREPVTVSSLPRLHRAGQTLHRRADFATLLEISDLLEDVEQSEQRPPLAPSPPENVRTAGVFEPEMMKQSTCWVLQQRDVAERLLDRDFRKAGLTGDPAQRGEKGRVKMQAIDKNARAGIAEQRRLGRTETLGAVRLPEGRLRPGFEYVAHPPAPRQVVGQPNDRGQETAVPGFLRDQRHRETGRRVVERVIRLRARGPGAEKTVGERPVARISRDVRRRQQGFETNGIAVVPGLIGKVEQVVRGFGKLVHPSIHRDASQVVMPSAESPAVSAPTNVSRSR